MFCLRHLGQCDLQQRGYTISDDSGVPCKHTHQQDNGPRVVESMWWWFGYLDAIGSFCHVQSVAQSRKGYRLMTSWLVVEHLPLLGLLRGHIDL